MIRRVLHDLGYVLAHVLFFGADRPRTIARRLRIAYRLVGVKIIETPRVDGTHRTIFLCPYRDLGRSRFGQKWICHDILDRVDDGYVTFLAKNKDLNYVRPRSCSELSYCSTSEYCFSEVSEPTDG